MGIVYKAEDLKLGRRVALKFLPEELADDQSALQRFEREARAASALNHPNICTIYGIEEHEGQPFIAMELLEGCTLREMIPATPDPSPLALAKLFDLAIQITEGLDAAHQKGIIHRDIKPSNIFVTNRGEAKILDFGVAKLLETAEPVESDDGVGTPDGAELFEISKQPAMYLTRTGTAMGTEGYMSPEQVRGEKLDARTDLFSLGLVLYEMATGRRAFSGETAAVLQEAILNQPPIPARQINPGLPMKLERIIGKALEKDRELRYQHASEMRDDLKSVASKIPQTSGDIVKTALRSHWSLLAAALLTAGLAAAAWYMVRPMPVLRVSEYIQLTHDGIRRTIGGTDATRLYLTRTKSPYAIEQVAVSGGEVAQIPIELMNPVVQDVSPDGSALLLGTILDNVPASPLWSVPILGGKPRRLGESEARGAAWSPDGKSLIYSTAAGEIFLARSDGTEPRSVASLTSSPDWHTTGSGQPGWQAPNDLSWSPDSRTIRFAFPNHGLPFWSFWEMSAGGAKLRPIHTSWHPEHFQCCGSWTPDGRFFLFLSDSQIWAYAERGRLFRQPATQPVQLTSGPMQWGNPVMSKDGKKIFSVGVTRRGELVRFNQQTGQFEPLLSGISAEGVTFSPNGKEVAYVSYPEGILWRQRLDGSGRVQLTDRPLYPLVPRWSPDGSQIVFMDIGSGGDNVPSYVVPCDGGSARRLLPKDAGTQADPNWSPDGRRIVFATMRGDPRSVIRILDLSSQQVSTLPGSEGVWGARWSPDGLSIVAVNFEGLKLYSFKTQKWSVLLKGEAGYHEFSHDSRFLYVWRWVSEQSLSRLRVSDGKMERLADLKDLQSTSALNRWMGFDPKTDSPLFLRDRSTRDVYALTLEEK
jgi:Tol biopolymer transport system component/tRNA A-37 threonylcarbamoyl transferase component Bud32